ncbi:MAG: HEAT repeat domain-containing protein [Methanocalculus sp.]|uniref:HEAT repeat domain-containing protein n=1 Tax=Methanocalculus sp. TaxID=2004547 RepID=UPI00272919F3|nr:HEAT repeat domain-containing protein [Methanocalculus sp.]MDO9539339.1 HEAT repeat domain-containing protein [Methanocalculus sp.]
MTGKDAILLLKKAVGEPDLTARRSAEEALASCGPSAIPEIVTALKEAKTTMRWYLARSIARMGLPAIQPTIDAIRSEDDPDVRRYLTGSLASIGEKAIPSLISSLADDDVGVRGAVALALLRIGDPALPALKKASEGDDPLLRTCAELVLFRMGEEGIMTLFSEDVE